VFGCLCTQALAPLAFGTGPDALTIRHLLPDIYEVFVCVCVCVCVCVHGGGKVRVRVRTRVCVSAW